MWAEILLYELLLKACSITLQAAEYVLSMSGPQVPYLGSVTQSDASGMRVSSVLAAMARALVPVGNALGAGFRPGGQAKAVRRSPPSVVRRPGRSLGPFRSTVWIATPASPGQGWRSSKEQLASVAAYFLCRECYGTGWIPYYSETVDGELEEAYRLCPNRCAARCCTRLKSDRPSRSGTVYYGSHYYCEEHFELIYADGNMKHIHEVFFASGVGCG